MSYAEFVPRKNFTDTSYMIDDGIPYMMSNMHNVEQKFIEMFVDKCMDIERTMTIVDLIKRIYSNYDGDKEFFEDTIETDVYYGLAIGLDTRKEFDKRHVETDLGPRVRIECGTMRQPSIIPEVENKLNTMFGETKITKEEITGTVLDPIVNEITNTETTNTEITNTEITNNDVTVEEKRDQEQEQTTDPKPVRPTYTMSHLIKVCVYELYDYMDLVKQAMESLNTKMARKSAGNMFKIEFLNHIQTKLVHKTRYSGLEMRMKSTEERKLFVASLTEFDQMPTIESQIDRIYNDLFMIGSDELVVPQEQTDVVERSTELVEQPVVIQTESIENGTEVIVSSVPICEDGCEEVVEKPGNVTDPSITTTGFSTTTDSLKESNNKTIEVAKSVFNKISSWFTS